MIPVYQMSAYLASVLLSFEKNLGRLPTEAERAELVYLDKMYNTLDLGKVTEEGFLAIFIENNVNGRTWKEQKWEVCDSFPKDRVLLQWYNTNANHPEGNGNYQQGMIVYFGPLDMEEVRKRVQIVEDPV